MDNHTDNRSNTGMYLTMGAAGAGLLAGGYYAKNQIDELKKENAMLVEKINKMNAYLNSMTNKINALASEVEAMKAKSNNHVRNLPGRLTHTGHSEVRNYEPQYEHQHTIASNPGHHYQERHENYTTYPQNTPYMAQEQPFMKQMTAPKQDKSTGEGHLFS